MKRVIRLFISGLAAILPVTVTLCVLYWLGNAAESFLGRGVKLLIPDSLYWPGMGVATGLVLVLATGVLMKAWLFRNLIRWSERLVERIPLVKALYGTVRDVLGFFSGSDGKTMQKAVIVTLGSTSNRLIGFITRDEFGELPPGIGDDDTLVVYFPMSYQIGGFTMMVPRQPLELGLGHRMHLRSCGCRSKLWRIGISRSDSGCTPLRSRPDSTGYAETTRLTRWGLRGGCLARSTPSFFPATLGHHYFGSSRLPSPMQMEALPMPPRYDLRLNDHQHRAPTSPKPRQPYPGNAVAFSQLRAVRLVLQDGKLLLEGEVLGGQPGLSSKKSPKEDEVHVYWTHTPLRSSLPYTYAYKYERSCGRGNVNGGSPRKRPRMRFSCGSDFWEAQGFAGHHRRTQRSNRHLLRAPMAVVEFVAAGTASPQASKTK